MERVPELSVFYEKVVQDARIGPSHIALYMALFQLWNVNGFQNPVLFKRVQVMKCAKLNGRATYHKCLRDLENYGYLLYCPSFDPSKPSRVQIVVADRKVKS